MHTEISIDQRSYVIHNDTVDIFQRHPDGLVYLCTISWEDIGKLFQFVRLSDAKSSQVPPSA